MFFFCSESWNWTVCPLASRGAGGRGGQGGHHYQHQHQVWRFCRLTAPHPVIRSWAVPGAKPGWKLITCQAVIPGLSSPSLSRCVRSGRWRRWQTVTSACGDVNVLEFGLVICCLISHLLLWHRCLLLHHYTLTGMNLPAPKYTILFF